MNSTTYRTHAVAIVLGTLLAACFLVALTFGARPTTFFDAMTGLIGAPSDPGMAFVVRELRLPRALTALLAGCALGVAGMLFQRLLANQLASPDFLGISSGASFGAAIAVLALGLVGVAVSIAALVGSLIAGTVIYLISWRGGIRGYRFILAGVGVAAFMLAMTGYVITRSGTTEARTAMRWLTGSVGLASNAEIAALAVGLTILLPAAALLSRPLRALELGDDTACGLGVAVEPMRLSLLLIGVFLVALAAAAVGPIMFVALIADPLSRRLTGAQRPSVLLAGLTGALMLLASDQLAQHLAGLPTGVVTGAVGAPYLVWILMSTQRQGSGR